MSIFFLEFLHWLSVFGWYAWVTGAFYEALFPAIWGLAIHPLISGQKSSFENLFIPAVTFVAMEALRNLGPLAMPWGDLAYTQWKFLSLIQVASLFGALGISFLIILVNVALSHGLKYKNPSRFFIALACIALPALFGLYRLQTHHPKTFPIALIQTDDTQLFKLSQAHYREMLLEMDKLVTQAGQSSPALIVLPETSFIGYLNEDAALQSIAQAWASRTKTTLAIGTLWRDNGQPENALALIDPNGHRQQVYAKVKLVPFGEYLPLFFKPLRGHWHVFDPIVDDQPGKNYTIFNLPQGNFGAMICFESSFGWMARKLALRGAQFLVVSTNDAWFYDTLAQEMHGIMAIYRAIETGRSCVQAGNTGVSCAVDERGRILVWNNEKKSAVVNAEIPLASGLTLYDHVGDIFPYACIIMAVGWWIKKK